MISRTSRAPRTHIYSRVVSVGVLALLALVTFAVPVSGAEVKRAGFCAEGRVSGSLHAECRLLLSIKHELDRDDQLNWGNNQIRYWDGVKVNKDGTAITVLNLRGMELRGSVPKQLGKLAGLERLNLGYNNLTGKIPPQLGKLRNLTTLHLENNELTGPIPSGLGRLSSLRILNLGNNNLSGTIPKELLNMTSLERLTLVSNELRGRIPVGFGSLSNFRHLHLSHNQLSGKLPADLGASASLQYLRVKNNQLTGKIPKTYEHRTWRCLLLSGNNLDDTCLPRSLRGKVKTQDMKACPPK